MSRGDYWETPQWLFRYCEKRWGPYDVDLAADPHNTKCEHFISHGENSLVQDWTTYGKKGFCNPPYSYPDYFVKRAIEMAERGFETTMILPTPNGERRDRLLFQAAELHFICGRVAFVDHGREISGNTRGTVIAHFAETAEPTPFCCLVNRDELRCRG